MKYKEINEEVLYTSEKITTINSTDIEILKNKAKNNKRKTIRLCCHRDSNDLVHDMIIVHLNSAYVRPHKRAFLIKEGTSLSYHFIEGIADLVFFDEHGTLVEVIKMMDCSSGGTFFFHIDEPLYYSPIVRSECIVFHEVTNGPFKALDTVYAAWAPLWTDENLVKAYRKRLERKIQDYMK